MEEWGPNTPSLQHSNTPCTLKGEMTKSSENLSEFI